MTAGSEPCLLPMQWITVKISQLLGIISPDWLQIGERKSRISCAKRDSSKKSSLLIPTGTSASKMDLLPKHMRNGLKRWLVPRDGLMNRRSPLQLRLCIGGKWFFSGTQTPGRRDGFLIPSQISAKHPRRQQVSRLSRCCLKNKNHVTLERGQQPWPLEWSDLPVHRRPTSQLRGAGGSRVPSLKSRKASTPRS